MRESALLEAENEGVEVSMSVEEKRRLELQENAINMAKEHPGDVAQLIRTWLMEE
jgi:flagellar M-ring protein FliF